MLTIYSTELEDLPSRKLLRLKRVDAQRFKHCTFIRKYLGHLSSEPYIA